MSYVDVEGLRPPELVAHYILACQGQDLFLPYQDYAVIDEWLQAAPDVDALLLILAELLPPFFGGKDQRSGAQAKVKSMVGLRKLVLRRLRDLRVHQP